MNEFAQLRIILFAIGGLLVLLVPVSMYFSQRRRTRPSLSDHETGVLNESGFLKQLSRPGALENGRTAVVSMQIDNLLTLCRLLNAKEYRRVLNDVSSALAAQLGGDSLVARMGEDSFCFVLRVAGHEEMMHTLEGVTRALARLCAGDSSAALAPVFGVCPCLSDGDSPAELLDKALLARTHTTPARMCRFYDAELDAELSMDHQLIDELGQARRRGELTVFYQPKFSLTERKISGAEVLIRWRHPQKGQLSPEMFIPHAEQHGLASQLDLFSFEEACRTLARWQDEGRELCPLSVNLSVDSVRRADLPEVLSEIGRRYRVPAGLIELEVGEPLLAEDPAAAKELFEQLHSCGFRCAVDRFGSGLCSTRLLGTLNPDTIKLDQSFFSGSNNDRQGRYLLENTIRLAAQLHARTIAVGVDSRGQVIYLQQAGCDEVQGFLFFRPMPGDRLNEAIYTGKELKVFSTAPQFNDAQKSAETHEGAQLFRNIILFSYWPREDEVEFSDSFSPVLKGQTRFKNAAALFRTTALIHENDRKDFLRLLELSQRTEGWREGTLRFCVSEMRYAWLDLRVRWERRNGTSRVSGMLVNMDGWRSEINRWKEKAERDVLTGLYNREHFEQTLSEQLRSGTCRTAGVLFIDVDDLKKANDRHGHLFGDSLLCYVAKQMMAVFRHTDVIARYGGDEFVVFAPNIPQDALELRIQKLYEAFRHPFRGDDVQLAVSVSIGVATYPQDGITAAELLEHADCALYEAKKQKNCRVIYEPYMKNTTTEARKSRNGGEAAE